MPTPPPRRRRWLATALLVAASIAGATTAQAATDPITVQSGDSCGRVTEYVFDPGGGSSGPALDDDVRLLEPLLPSRAERTGGWHAVSPALSPSAADAGSHVRAVPPLTPPPAGGLVSIRASELNYLPIERLTDSEVAPHWGMTTFDAPAIEVGFGCVDASTGTYRATITKADQTIRQGTRLLTSVAEVTPALIQRTSNSTAPLRQRCTILTKMADDLQYEATVAGTGVEPIGPPPRPRTPTQYYVEAAVQAHENVHVEHYKAAIEAPYRTFKRTVETTVITASSDQEAIDKFRPRLQAAAATLLQAKADFHAAEKRHEPPSAYQAAEQAVVTPMIDRIRSHRKILGCP